MRRLKSNISDKKGQFFFKCTNKNMSRILLCIRLGRNKDIKGGENISPNSREEKEDQRYASAEKSKQKF